MKKKRHSVHDTGYKKLFSNPELVRQLLTSFVDESWVHDIDYSRLERIDKSFITDEFAQKESDMIYKAFFREKEFYIFILLEFQSTVDRFMSLRMLRYIAELYEYLIKCCRIKTLPAVFPVMLYNGEKKWTAPAELNRLIEKSIPGRYIPEFMYYKIAENEFSRDFLKTIKNSIGALFYTENCSTEELQSEISTVVSLLRSEKPAQLSLFVSWFRYMFHNEEVLAEEVKKIEEVKTMLSTSIKKLKKEAREEGVQKGIQKGMEKGVQQGMQKKALETASSLLREGMSVKKIAEITGLSVDEVKRLKS